MKVCVFYIILTAHNLFSIWYKAWSIYIYAFAKGTEFWLYLKV